MKLILQLWYWRSLFRLCVGLYNIGARAMAWYGTHSPLMVVERPQDDVVLPDYSNSAMTRTYYEKTDRWYPSTTGQQPPKGYRKADE